MGNVRVTIALQKSALIDAGQHFLEVAQEKAHYRTQTAGFVTISVPEA